MRAVFLLVCLSLAACDSGAPSGGSGPVVPPVTPPVTPPVPVLSRFAFSDVPALLTYEAGEQVTVFPLSFFGQTRPPGVAFTARSTGAAVTVQRSQIGLEVQAVSEGMASIAVTFAAPGYRDSTVAVPVEVAAARCPPGAAAGARDYVPAQAGTVWTFGYSQREEPSGGGNGFNLVRGTLTFTFGAPTCLRGTRTWPVTQRLSGDRRASEFSTPVPFTEQATNVLREDADNRVAFTVDLLPAISHTAGVARYRVPSGGGTQGVPGQVSCARPPNDPLPSMEFNPGIGLSVESASCVTAAGTVSRYVERRN